MVAKMHTTLKRPPNPKRQLVIDLSRKIFNGISILNQDTQLTGELANYVDGLKEAIELGGKEDFWKAWGQLERYDSEFKNYRKLIEAVPPAADDPAPVEPAERPYQLYPLSYFKNRPRKEWAVDGIHFDRGSSVICAPGGSGKSAFVLDMEMSRVCNIPFLGKAVKPTFLVWVAAESMDELYPRASAWLKCHGISEDEPLNMLILDGRMPLNDPEETEKFILSVNDQLKNANVTPGDDSITIVFDTYSKCTPGADENSTKEVKMIVELVDRISSEVKAHVLIICHTNAEGLMKGNKALRDGVDTVWMVSKNDETICLTIDKMRGAPEPEKIYACMRSIVLDENDPSETAPVIFAMDEKIGSIRFTPNAQTQMLTILQANGEMFASKWQEQCEILHEIKRATFFNHLKILISRGLVPHPPEGTTRGTKVLYSLTPAGIELLESSLK